MQTISFVFPVYNEEETLPKLFAEMERIAGKLPPDLRAELVFVDDGSRDHSYALLVAYAAHRPHVKVVRFARNFGHQIACTAGIDHASGDAVIMMDADLQDPPDIALELIATWRTGVEVVYAKRRTRPQDESWLKRVTAHWYYRILNALSDIPIPTDTGDFRLMDRKVVDVLAQCREHSRYLRGLTTFIGFRQEAVLFDRADRYAGTPKYKLFKQSLKLAADGLTGFSTKPLRLISHLGFLVAVLSFLGAAYVLGKRIFFPAYTVSGFTILVILLSLFSGMQMLILGLIGAYVGRIYTEAQDRPLYIVRETLNHPKSHG